MTQTEVIPTKRFRLLPLVLMVLLFALPPLLGWLFFLNPEWLPQGTNNNGEIIQAQPSVDELPLRTADGNAFNWGGLRDKWVLTSLTSGSCGVQCREHLGQHRQIRLALGANRQRVARLLIVLPDAPAQAEFPAEEILDGTLAGIVEHAGRHQFVASFMLDRPGALDASYLIDPRGRLVMTHDPSLPSKAILRDLEKLLKASQNWVKGAQYGHK